MPFWISGSSCNENCEDKRTFCKEEKVIDKKGTSHIKVYRKGKINEEFFLLNGLRDSIYTQYYYAKTYGKKMYAISYKEGKRNGLSIIFFENGDTELVSNYRNDTLDGAVYWFSENGELAAIHNFQNDIYVSSQYFDSTFVPSWQITSKSVFDSMTK